MAFATRSAILIVAAYALLVLSLDMPAWSQPTEKPEPESKTDLWERETLLGDIGGLRPLLAEYGAKLEIIETSEVLGNISGGFRRGVVYEGLTDLSLSVDLKTYFGAPGTLFARAYQIHGRGLTANYLGNLATASGIEATRTTRLFELWYEAPVADWLQLRLGQQSASTEFKVSTTSQLFVNATFGWPTLPSLDLPSGGPNYPLATPGLRLKATPSDELSLLFGLFNGDPAGPGAGDPQMRDASGTAFRINDGTFVIAEAQYMPGNSGRNGTYRLGGWFHSGEFSDPRFDISGISLANPGSSGEPRQHKRNYALYAVVDYPILDAQGEGGATAFTRIMGAPGDRNLVDFYVDGGLTYTGPFDRKDDKLGVAVAYTRIGAAARGFDADVARFTGRPFPLRSAEILIEVTYRMQLAPWWQLQPDFQYVFNPAGGVLNPRRPARRLGDTAVLGMRTAVTF